MVIRISRSISLTVYNHDEQAGDSSWERAFRRGETFQIGEWSPAEISTIFEIEGLGYVEIPNDCWLKDDGIFFRFAPDCSSRN